MQHKQFTPKPPIRKSLYRHYSGKRYEVLDVVCHSETLEWLVLYKRLYDADGSELWVRPSDMFLETVEVEGETVPRFTYVGSDETDNIAP